MNPQPALIPAARALRTEIVCRCSTLFTHSAAHRAMCLRPPGVDPYGDAAHLIGRLRDEGDGPAHEGRLLDADGPAAALKAASPARPIHEW